MNNSTLAYNTEICADRSLYIILVIYNSTRLSNNVAKQIELKNNEISLFYRTIELFTLF